MDCRAFDEQVVRRDPKVATLMDKFVCVRVVQANALDLALFQFDYDLTFAAFFVNADRTIYGRYGSRSDRKDATKDISIEGRPPRWPASRGRPRPRRPTTSTSRPKRPKPGRSRPPAHSPPRRAR